MNEPYEIAALHFFEGKPLELALYEAFAEKVLDAFPEAIVQVQKTQVAFSNRHHFAFVSLPVRRVKGWPEHCIIVTFGLFYRLKSPRISIAVEPYPNRWTHHVLVSDEDELDSELMNWISEAYAFSKSKR
ncbi:MAG: DUF5655 domain-containing protein [Peptococcaceae bacterium]|nr:DUF5655 domain-containing protein [Peptococcaceae bacterium]